MGNLYKDISNFYHIYDMPDKVCTTVRNKKKVNRFECFKLEHVYHIYNKLNRKKEDELIDNIAKSLVQFCYLDGEGKLNFSDTIDYEKFHYTVSFISEYEQELTKEHSSELKKVRTKNTFFISPIIKFNYFLHFSIILSKIHLN